MKDALNKMERNKTPDNEELIEKLFKKLWSKIKNPLLLVFKNRLLTEELSIYQKQAVIKLLNSLKKKIEIKSGKTGSQYLFLILLLN